MDFQTWIFAKKKLWDSENENFELKGQKKKQRQKKKKDAFPMGRRIKRGPNEREEERRRKRRIRRREARRAHRDRYSGESHWARSTGWTSERELRRYVGRVQLRRWAVSGDVNRAIGEGGDEARRRRYVYDLESVARAVTHLWEERHRKRVWEKLNGTGAACGESDELEGRLRDACAPASEPIDPGATASGRAGEAERAGMTRTLDPMEYGFGWTSHLRRYLRGHGYEEGKDYSTEASAVAEKGSNPRGRIDLRVVGTEGTAAKLRAERRDRGRRWKRRFFARRRLSGQPKPTNA